ncbi:MAG: ribosome hibernation-promoting factor, HPF/YfiA family [Mycoplasma sp.]
MKLNIRYKDMDKPLGIDEFVEKKVSKLSKFTWIHEDVKVDLTKFDKGVAFKALIHVIPNHGNTLVGEAEANDLKAAIDLAMDKLNSQIVKYKETHFNH